MHTRTHATFIHQPLSFPPAHGGDTETVKCHPHNSATFTVNSYQYLLPMGPGASCKTTLAFIQKPLLSDSDSNTIQFPDHGKNFY